jgi:predicted metalloprotease with PDZ domain
MEQPSTHYYHVLLRCTGLAAETQDFSMPAWTPGYYKIMDYAKNVLSFHAEDEAGRPLAWQKVSKNTWRVNCCRAKTFTVAYDVYAFAQSVADSWLDDDRAFLSPTSLYVYPQGHLRHPMTVEVQPYPGSRQISTGLDPVEGRANTFSAPDFDTLYDSPILIGRQEILSFEVRGIPHTVAVEDLGTFDRQKFVADLKRIVESATAVVGEIPYRHYTFIIMREGQGGLEHLNSCAVFNSASSLSDPAGYKRWLGFICHEYFHLYNVKSIRPIALGPFDYDKENYTDLLWFSEGATVYYEDLILNRAGLRSRDECLENYAGSIKDYEHIPGHRFQSASASSFDVWLLFFFRSGNASNATISYYDKGAALGMLLDLEIRHRTRNQKSLDDVMRVLYQTYYVGKKRGFTDEEFRQACEAVAGGSLAEILDTYATTVADIDYGKFLAYAGLDIDTQPKDAKEAYLGASTQDQDGRLVISSVERDSPAWQAGLSSQDEILALDGRRASSKSLGQRLESGKPGDKIRVLVSRRDVVCEKEVVLGKKSEADFTIKPMANPDALQSETLNAWLR